MTYTPEKLLKFFKDFDYGFIHNNERLTGDDLDYNLYKIMTPKEVLKYKVGTCWDYTTVEYLLFKKYMPDIVVQCFYIEAEDDTNHTWLVFYRDNKVNIFEHAWQDYRGIHEFTTETEMLNYYTIRFLQETSSFTNPIIIYKYIPPKQYHLSPDEFMHYVTTTGQFVNDTDNYRVSVKKRNIIYENFK